MPTSRSRSAASAAAASASSGRSRPSCRRRARAAARTRPRRRGPWRRRPRGSRRCGRRAPASAAAMRARRVSSSARISSARRGQAAAGEGGVEGVRLLADQADVVHGRSRLRAALSADRGRGKGRLAALGRRAAPARWHAWRCRQGIEYMELCLGEFDHVSTKSAGSNRPQRVPMRARRVARRCSSLVAQVVDGLGIGRPAPGRRRARSAAISRRRS